MTIFALPAAELHAAAEWTARATPAKTTVPILSGVLIEAEGDGVTFSGFDFYRLASVTVGVHVGRPGRVLVPGRLLAAVAGVADKGAEVTFDATGGTAELTAGRARWKLPLLPAEDYPELPVPGEPAGTVDAAQFCRAARRVLPAASREAGLENLRGVKVESQDGQLTFAATDRYRLAYSTIPWLPAGEDALDALVPASLLEVAARGAETGELRIHVGDGSRWPLFGVSSDTHLVVGAQVALEYPQWRQLVPPFSEQVTTVASDDLARALKQVLPAVDKLPQVKLIAADGSVTLEVRGAGQDAEAELEAKTEGDSIEVTFSSKYLKEALEGLGAREVQMFFTAPHRPVRMIGDDPECYEHIVMPARGVG
uniref:DNA polymerase III subunit beta n=1 Tax=Pseudonocardia sp. CA-138482 TaxID=3240023 RepID=UPI003F499C03